jgi:hypothetical protein
MNEADTKAGVELRHEDLTEQIIGAAIEVHKAIGPALWSLSTRNAFVMN